MKKISWEVMNKLTLNDKKSTNIVVRKNGTEYPDPKIIADIFH